MERSAATACALLAGLALLGCGPSAQRVEQDAEPAPRAPEATPAAPAAVDGAVAPSAAPPLIFDLPLSVDEAYASIPHRRTVFPFDESPLDTADAAYLRGMFRLVEEGTRVRVVAWRDLYQHDATAHDPAGKLLALIQRVEAIRPPARLAAYHDHVRTALTEQRAFFMEWIAAGAGFRARAGAELAAHPRVRRASEELLAAYQELMREYGAAVPPHGREAFFDYHCALDFL